jgi:protein-S-isoprenylcysteine O-methyltransferase Ste14
MEALKLKIPPPIVTVTYGLCMWAVARIAPAFAFALPYRGTLASIVAIAGGLIGGAAICLFFRTGTSIDSMRPDSASSFVCSSIYSRTRNPMYLGLFFALAGWSLYLSNWLSLVLVPLFVASMNYLQIEPEEKALEAKFGQASLDYKARVRRWL